MRGPQIRAGQGKRTHLTEIQAASGVPFLVRIEKEKYEKQIDARAQGRAPATLTQADSRLCCMQEMIFFDDLPANVRTGMKLGITCVCVKNLLCAKTLQKVVHLTRIPAPSGISIVLF